MSKRTGLIGTKIGNSSFYDASGKSLPVTILKIDECIVCLKALLKYLNLEHLLETEWSYVSGNVTEKEYLEK